MSFRFLIMLSLPSFYGVSAIIIFLHFRNAKSSAQKMKSFTLGDIANKREVRPGL